MVIKQLAVRVKPFKAQFILDLKSFLSVVLSFSHPSHHHEHSAH